MKKVRVFNCNHVYNLSVISDLHQVLLNYGTCLGLEVLFSLWYYLIKCKQYWE